MILAFINLSGIIRLDNVRLIGSVEFVNMNIHVHVHYLYYKGSHNGKYASFFTVGYDNSFSIVFHIYFYFISYA